jgi:hypothetical protein
VVGDARANLATSRLTSDGRLRLDSMTSTELVVEVLGFYA